MTEALPPNSSPYLVLPEDEGARIDSYLARLLPDYSRTTIRQAISQGKVTVDGRIIKGAFRLRAGHCVAVDSIQKKLGGPQPESIQLNIVYEDEHLIVVNKPPGMVVHPARGHWSGTLASALVHHCQVLSTVGGPSRPGIVHRLDRDTSGVIIAAKSDLAHLRLAEQFEKRTTKKTYLALVRGAFDRDRDRIEQPIGKHPYQREKMAIRAEHATSRDATTEFVVAKRLGRFTLIEVHPLTGRTHQIRVHLAHQGTPVLADRLYAGHSMITSADLGGEGTDVVLDRQALHAFRLELDHPATQERMIFEAPLPSDMKRAIAILEESLLRK
jgi:23S rRNA pseudouridine1911/1915/1917 synthase